MAESKVISMEAFRVLVERAGLELTSGELEALKPMYDDYAERLSSLHDLDLGAEDLAVVFRAAWDPSQQTGQVQQ
jgi:hypothetical protein